LNLEETLRNEGGRVLATLIRLTGDFQLAEDALQEASLSAVEIWSKGHIPDNPAAWLTAIARNKALDRMRRETKRSGKELEAMRLLVDDSLPDDGHDDRLRLIFTCCHPALSVDSRVALSLRTICGLTTVEIARAYLTSETTMGQRISRAKKKIATARIPYRVPAAHELPDRLASVLAVVYLVYTMGHHAGEGRLDSRTDLAIEAIRLGRLLVELMPDEPEAAGLLALMLATDARRKARLDKAGEVLLLADQDRSQWNHHQIREASELVERNLRRGARGEYLLEGAIASLHGLASNWDETDWRQIVELYRMLELAKPTVVVRVNRAVAEAELSGPEAGLRLLDDVEGVANWHLYWSTRAELLHRSGLFDQAAAAYRDALTCPMNESDRHFLEQRLASLSALN